MRTTEYRDRSTRNSRTLGLPFGSILVVPIVVTIASYCGATLTPWCGGQATTRYTWNTSAYSRFTFVPCVRATFHTYSLFA
jgi:hypothetical protein